jgi:hypothetical protein
MGLRSAKTLAARVIRRNETLTLKDQPVSRGILAFAQRRLYRAGGGPQPRVAGQINGPKCGKHARFGRFFTI